MKRGHTAALVAEASTRGGPYAYQGADRASTGATGRPERERGCQQTRTGMV